MKRILAVAAVAAAVSTSWAALSIVTDRPGAFVNISGTGTFIDSTDDSTHIIVTTVGNFALPAGNTSISNNGNARFFGGAAASGAGAFTNAAIPNPGPGHPTGLTGGNPTGILMALWDDNIPTAAANSGIYHQTIGNTLIIQWNEEDHFASPGTGTVTYQMQVFNTGSNGDVLAQILYLDTEYTAGDTVSNGASATIGYSTATPAGPGLNNVAQSFNVAGSATPAIVYTLIPEPASLSLLALGALALIRRR